MVGEPINSGIDSIQVYSNCVLMIEKDTGDIIFERNANEKMYPASTTKILTAIITLENCSLDDIVTVGTLAIIAVPDGYMTAKLQIGENLRVEDLLYAMLIPSANDAANALAEHISGSLASFSDLMNEKAKELGCTNSHFTNPSGVHDENLFTTASDLAIIARYAMNNEKFREIVSTTEYTLPSTEKYPHSDRKFINSNFLINPNDSNYYYEYATGIKTGFTNPSKECIVASAKKDNVEFITVILGSDVLDNGLKEKFIDCKTLFNFAFDNYTAYYQNLQEKKLKESTVEMSSTNYHYLEIMSKVVCVSIIIVSFLVIFRNTEKE